MDLDLSGKTALVTAAGQGIGHASVLALAAEGATVWATDVNEKLLQRFDALRPERPIAVEPSVHLRQPLRIDAVVDVSPAALLGDETGRSQHGQMLRYRRAGD